MQEPVQKRSATSVANAPTDTALPPWPTQRGPLYVAVLLLVALAIQRAGAAPAQALQQLLLIALGAALGLVLYHAAFGFAAAYRKLITRRDVRDVTAQLLMLAVATVLFAPVLAKSSVFGHGVVGAVAPLGVQVAVGAFLFGVGMQLANGCGSGTLFSLGGGSVRMLATLALFVAGSFLASLHMDFWQAQPALPELSLGEHFGWSTGVALQLAFLALLWRLLGRWGRSAGALPAPADAASPVRGARVLLTGPWPILIGALLLALLNFATLLLSGHPWSITWAFTLWGAKTALLLGWDPSSSAFWQGGFQEAALGAPLLDDETSLMDISLLLGAMVAATLAGRFKPSTDIPWRSLAAALIGGLLMGYGSRIAFGCNVGAFFSGVASTSLHGWLWIACALPGVWVGVRLRPRFGLSAS